MGRFSKPKGFWQGLINPDDAKTAFRVALIVGSVLFAIYLPSITESHSGKVK